MKRMLLKLGIAILMMATLVACRDTKDNEEPKMQEGAYYQFVDDVENELTLIKKPAKVAVLFSSYADIWKTAGGVVDITVGESVERGFAEGDAVLVDEGAGKTIDVEALVAAEPDFVICSADIEAQVKVAQLLNGSSIPTACFRVDNFSDYLRVLKICTDITGNKEAYEEYGIKVKERVDEILEQAKELSDERKILFIRAGSSASATKAKTAEENFVCEMLQELGTYNIAQEAPVLLDGLSIEEILIQDPQYIFIATMGKEEAAIGYMDSILKKKEWQQLAAVKEGNYAYLPKELFQYKPNSKWDEAYKYLMDLLYGEE